MTTKRKRMEKVGARSAEPSREGLVTWASVSPCMTAAAVLTEYAHGVFGEQSLEATCNVLDAQTKRVHGGNMRGVESTLVAQAAALNSMFTNLAKRANKQDGLPQFQAFLNLALRAQNQCRMTLETLSTIKNPPAIFAKQANIANNQQVNNAPARETGKPQSKLLELTHEKPSMDIRAATQTIRSHPAMATVDAFNGATDGDRQGHIEP